MSQSDATLLHSRAVRIFVSYSHKDEPQYPQPHEFKWLSYVQSELAPLAASGDVEYWTDESNTGGMDWDTRIKQALETCDIFVLLVSPNSLSSEYIIRTEVPAILQRQQECESKEQPVLFPLVIRTVDQGVLDSFEWLRTPNRRPPNGKALSEFRLDGTIDQRGPEMQRVLSDLRELASRISDNQAIETGCHSHCKRSKPDLEEQPGDTRGPVVHPPIQPRTHPVPMFKEPVTISVLLGIMVALAGIVIARMPKEASDFFSINAIYIIVVSPALLLAFSYFIQMQSRAAVSGLAWKTQDVFTVDAMFALFALSILVLSFQYFLILAPRDLCPTRPHFDFLLAWDWGSRQQLSHCMRGTETLAKPYYLEPPILQSWLHVILPAASCYLLWMARNNWRRQISRHE